MWRALISSGPLLTSRNNILHIKSLRNQNRIRVCSRQGHKGALYAAICALGMLNILLYFLQFLYSLLAMKRAHVLNVSIVIIQIQTPVDDPECRFFLSKKLLSPPLLQTLNTGDLFLPGQVMLDVLIISITSNGHPRRVKLSTGASRGSCKVHCLISTRVWLTTFVMCPI